MLRKTTPPLRYQIVVRGNVPEVAAYSATDLDFLQSSSQGQLWDAEHENDLHLNFQGYLKFKFKVKGRDTGYRPKNTSAAIRKWFQTIASLPEQMA